MILSSFRGSMIILQPLHPHLPSSLPGGNNLSCKATTMWHTFCRSQSAWPRVLTSDKAVLLKSNCFTNSLANFTLTLSLLDARSLLMLGGARRFPGCKIVFMAPMVTLGFLLSVGDGIYFITSEHGNWTKHYWQKHSLVCLWGNYLWNRKTKYNAQVLCIAVYTVKPL